MRSTRLVIHRLCLDGVELGIRFGTLVAVERDETDQVEWEIVADGIDEYEGALARHHVETLCITGSDASGHLILGELEGDVVVVRFSGRTVVLRGDGPLSGLKSEMFER